MKRSYVILLMMMMMPFGLFGQTYQALWNKAADAEKKDLPQTQLAALRQIVEKAGRERAYGQLLKAELKAAQVEASVAPDSLLPAVERLQERCAAIKDDAVLKAVYQTVLWQIGQRHQSLSSLPAGGQQAEKPVLTPQLCRQLAEVKDETYEPFVITGADSKVFGHDLLSIVGYALGDYKPLSDYYAAVGNRPAACLTALEYLKSQSSTLNSQLSTPSTPSSAAMRTCRRPGRWPWSATTP